MTVVTAGEAISKLRIEIVAVVPHNKFVKVISMLEIVEKIGGVIEGAGLLPASFHLQISMNNHVSLSNFAETALVLMLLCRTGQSNLECTSVQTRVYCTRQSSRSSSSPPSPSICSLRVESPPWPTTTWTSRSSSSVSSSSACGWRCHRRSRAPAGTSKPNIQVKILCQVQLADGGGVRRVSLDESPQSKHSSGTFVYYRGKILDRVAAVEVPEEVGSSPATVRTPSKLRHLNSLCVRVEDAREEKEIGKGLATIGDVDPSAVRLRQSVLDGANVLETIVDDKPGAVLMWLLAVTCGMVVGKTILHGVILSRLFRLKMFRDDQGSWMVQCLTVIISLYLFSHLYNMILVLFYEHVSRDLTINSMMTITHSSVMKAAACGTWTGGLITALIITDMMLQDTVYPDWAPGVRAVWQRSQIPRILLFWAGSIIIATMVILVIVTDWINWDKLNRDFVATSELSRAFLASCILVMDLTIVMQDWDFPHFTTTLDVNLPGFHKHAFNFQAMEIQISGKWFNYGIIFLVMILDLNMWKNQMFYKPQNYGQYVGPFNRVYTVTNQTILEMSGNLDYRATTINPETKKPYSDGCRGGLV